MYKAFQKLIPLQFSFLIWFIPIVFFLNFNPFFYSKFDQYQVYDNFVSDSRESIVNNFDSIMQFINLRNGSLDTQFFSDQDIIHLSDVRNLVAGVYLVTAVLIVILILNRKLIKKEWRGILKNVSLVNLFIAIVLTPLLALNFNNLFILFHRIFFRNEYWILDPQTSNLIKFFPEEVFFEIAIYTTVFVIMSSILGLISWKLLTKKYSSLADT